MHLRSFRLVHFFVLCFYAAPLGYDEADPRGAAHRTRGVRFDIARPFSSSMFSMAVSQKAFSVKVIHSPVVG